MLEELFIKFGYTLDECIAIINTYPLTTLKKNTLYNNYPVVRSA